MNIFLKLISLFFVGIGVVIIIVLRVKGLHLTEGELLVEYWPQWILSFGLLFGGYAIFVNTD